MAMNHSAFTASLATLGLLLSGCATLSSSHSSPFGLGLTPPEAHATASELTGPLEIIPMPLRELDYSSLSDFKGPIRQVTRYRFCRGPCLSEHMDQQITFDEAGRVSESLGSTGLHRTYYYAGDSEHPYRHNSRSTLGDYSADTYYRHDEYGNVLSSLRVSAGKRSSSRYVFRHHSDQYSFQSIARSLDPAYSENSAPGSLMFRDGRMVKRVTRMGTIDVSTGRSGPPVDSVYEWDYVPYSSGVLMLKRQRSFSNGQHTGTRETFYSAEGLELLATGEDRAIGSSEISHQYETRYQQYVLDEHDNWVSRQGCTTENQRPEECYQEQRKITYY